MQTIRSLADCTLGHNANNTCSVYITGFCKLSKIHTKLTHKSATSNTHSFFTEIRQACRPHRNENAKLQASISHNSFVAKFKEKSTFLHDRA